MADEQHRPTVLMVGQGEPIQATLGEALRRHGLSLAGCATSELENAIKLYAPDLVALIGDAAVRSGANVIRRMAANPATDVLPVVVISNDAVLKRDMPGFRTGAVAIVPRGVGADTIARRLAELANEVPKRAGYARGEINQDNLHEVVDLLSNDLKTGFLSIESTEGRLEGTPIVLDTDRPSTQDLDVMLNRLRDALSRSQRLEYEFHEASAGRLCSLSPGMPAEAVGDPASLRGTRMVVLDTDQLRAEELAQILREEGVQIVAADFSTAVIPRMREIDPQVAILDAAAVGGEGIDVVRAMRQDRQLRWASMLVVRWEELWPSHASGPDVAKLANRIAPLVQQDKAISRRTEEEIDFDTRLELVGPGRLLRALGGVPGVRHISVRGNDASIEVDIADNAVLGAFATVGEHGSEQLQGLPALKALWTLNSGRVSVREQELPSIANIMMPVDEALGVVSRELDSMSEEGSAFVDAATIPPKASEDEASATLRPQLEAALEAGRKSTTEPRPSAGSFPLADEEARTGKVRQPIGRVETQRMSSSSLATLQEGDPDLGHRDHALAGLTPSIASDVPPTSPSNGRSEPPTDPVPEVSEHDDHPTIPIATAKPAASSSHASAPGADEFEAELATVLEGPVSIPTTAQPPSKPTWLRMLLLVALVGGAAILAWGLWPPGDDESLGADGPSPQAGSAPVTGPVVGLAVVEEEVGVETEPEPPTPTRAAPENEAAIPPKPPVAPVPDHGLPKDAARASDVLVHRAIPMIREGDLARAEATLDRAWELDPKNPQAMAAYARLFLAKEDGRRAEKWAAIATRRRPRRPQYAILLGDALLMQGKVVEARKAWRRALRVDRGNRIALSRLAKTAE